MARTGRCFRVLGRREPAERARGHAVTVTLSDFGAGCVVYFDDDAGGGRQGLRGTTTLVFDVPESAAVGDHEIRAVRGRCRRGWSSIQTCPSRSGRAATTPPITRRPSPSPRPTSTWARSACPTTVARPVTTVAGVATPSPTTTRRAAGGPTTTATAGQLTSRQRRRTGWFRGRVQARRGGPHALRGGPHGRPAGGFGVRVDLVGVGGHVQ